MYSSNSQNVFGDLNHRHFVLIELYKFIKEHKCNMNFNFIENFKWTIRDIIEKLLHKDNFKSFLCASLFLPIKTKL